MSRLRLGLASILFAATAYAGNPSHFATPPASTPGQIDRGSDLDRAVLRTKLAARRAQVFQRFLAYRNARSYPINNLPGGGFRHVWLDDAGNLCAAATLVSKDWGRDAAIRAGAANREIKLADIKTGPLADWILTSGLTHHEIVAIQVPGFEMPVAEPRDTEVARLYGIYVDVERQLRSLWDESLDDATDQLMKHPELAHDLMHDRYAGPGMFAKPSATPPFVDEAPAVALHHAPD